MGNNYQSENGRFLTFSLIILLPWACVFAVRYLGPIGHPPLGFDLLFYFLVSNFLTFLSFSIGYFLSFRNEPARFFTFTRNVNRSSDTNFLIFSRIRLLLFVLSVLYPTIACIDFFIVKGASLSTIIEQREAEHLSGPRNSAIGAIGALLSGAPPILLALLIDEKNIVKRNNFIFFIIAFGFFSMFLSGGRNAFFISIIYFFVYRFLFASQPRVTQGYFNFKKFIFYIFFLYAFYFSMVMFLERFEAQGFSVYFMLDYLEQEYNIKILRPSMSDYFVPAYSIFVYLCFYISHAFTYLNEYFVFSYEPYLGGSYNFPQLARLIDVFYGTNMFGEGRDRMLLTGVYLTLPGSLYIDFGYFGSLVINSILGFVFGFLAFNVNRLPIAFKLCLTYLCVAFIFSPIYGIFGMANGFSIIFILIVAVIMSFKIRY